MIKKFVLLFSIGLITSIAAFSAPDGKALFQNNCASCHNPIKDATGPALQGVDKRVPDKEWIYKWIHNPAAVIASGDKYANEIYNKWNKTNMTAFPNLKNDEIDAIVQYVNDYKAPVATTPSGGGAASGASSSDNGFLIGVITITLLIAVLVLSQVNKLLRKLPTTQLVSQTQNPYLFSVIKYI